MTLRTVLTAVAAVVLAAGAVVLLRAGVRFPETTGGLLVAPYAQVELLGGYLLGGTAAGVAAVLCAGSAGPALWHAARRRRRRDVAGSGTGTVTTRSWRASP